ncbi:N-acetylglutamate synthase [Treponema bryantii]|uniref:amino-acid N-acetyltransferase n=1 Tax=Treponema bryantii TaxID=163 RepID=A0A1H9GRV9_9SPIR|nr:amino-acid N-acetyltransferase [Treponema bryantii]BDC94615.1 amino-acid acetyltransferase [Treponema bryantii]SEQ52804.1 N-acetylglutamate synthase [Treponema bryantii]
MTTSKTAENVRDVIRYLQKFKNALLVIYLDDKTISSPLFSSHIRDIAMLHQAGLKVVLIPGARRRIDEVLDNAKIKWTYNENMRVTTPDAMPLIKMAAFDVSNTVMTSLAANNITAVIGNWVRARGKGVLNGFDYGTAGEIDKLETDAICTVLNDGFIPIFPCIGWNAAGHPYNISSMLLAKQVAMNLKADKLFFMMFNEEIKAQNYAIPEGLALSETGNIPAMDLEEVDRFLDANPSISGEIRNLMKASQEACRAGVTRVHILNGNKDGVLPCEIFSGLGSGTMIYTGGYGKVRPMVQTDIPSVLSIMRPFMDAGKLLPRTEAQLSADLADYIVFELDGGVHACAALHFYQDGQAEIAAVAVDENYAHMGIGPKLMDNLIEQATQADSTSIFIMTTQTADWFEQLGFVEDTIDSLPEERQKLWTPQRNSKVYRLKR